MPFEVVFRILKGKQFYALRALVPLNIAMETRVRGAMNLQPTSPPAGLQERQAEYDQISVHHVGSDETAPVETMGKAGTRAAFNMSLNPDHSIGFTT